MSRVDASLQVAMVMTEIGDAHVSGGEVAAISAYRHINIRYDITSIIKSRGGGYGRLVRWWCVAYPVGPTEGSCW